MDLKDNFDNLKFYKSLQLQYVNYILILQGVIAGLKNIFKVEWVALLNGGLIFLSAIVGAIGFWLVYMTQERIRTFAKRAKGNDNLDDFEKRTINIPYRSYQALIIISFIILTIYAVFSK